MAIQLKASIGIDIGSTAVKGVVLSEEGKILAAKKVSNSYLPAPEEAPIRREFAPRGVYGSLCGIIKGLLQQAERGEKNADIKGLSINCASGNAILLNREKKPVSNVVSWLDRRAEHHFETILPGIKSEELHEIVGWPWRGSFTLALLAWLKKFAPDRYKTAAFPAMYMEYLLFLITGCWEIDTSNATLSFLQNQLKREWYPPYCESVDIDPGDRPLIRRTGDIIDFPSKLFFEDSNLPPGVSVVHGSFDHPGAARAVGVATEEDILLSCGTSWVVFCPFLERETSIQLGLLTDPFLSPWGGPWGGMFSLSRIGTVIDQYIDVITDPKKGDKYSQFNTLAAQTSPGAGGLFINVMEHREKVISPEHERTAGHSPASIARALMEGPAFELTKHLKHLEKAGRKSKRIVLVGGPAESTLWPQIIADITGLYIEIHEGQFTGSLGAAYTAGKAVGILDPESFRKSVTEAVTIIEPNLPAHTLYTALYEEYCENERS